MSQPWLTPARARDVAAAAAALAAQLEQALQAREGGNDQARVVGGVVTALDGVR